MHAVFKACMHVPRGFRLRPSLGYPLGLPESSLTISRTPWWKLTYTLCNPPRLAWVIMQQFASLATCVGDRQCSATLAGRVQTPPAEVTGLSLLRCALRSVSSAPLHQQAGCVAATTPLRASSGLGYPIAMEAPLTGAFFCYQQSTPPDAA